MKIIRELNEQVECLSEEKDGKKRLYVEGIALQSGVKNRNNRIYPPPLLDREVGRYIKESVENGNSYGEFGHPSTGPKINENLISHRIVSMKKDGNNWIGRAVIIEDGAPGKLVKGIIETGGKLGVSSRGLGTVKYDQKLEADIVQDDFRICVGYDLVTNPSGPNCWLDNIIMENTIDWSQDENGVWIAETAENIKKTVKNLSKRELEEKQLSFFNYFLSEMAKPRQK